MNRRTLIVLTFFAVAALLASSWVLERKLLQAEEVSQPIAEVTIGAEALSFSFEGNLVNFVGGWVLTSENDDFGGFSGLVVDAPSQTLLAINDKGDWWQAAFDLTSGEPPVSGVLQAYVPGAQADKVDLDAESLVRFRDGYLVSFEQRHRLEFVESVGSQPQPTGLAPINFVGVSNNSGVEAMAVLPSGGVLAFAERGLNVGGHLKAWLVTEDSVQNIYFKPPANFAPTDAATLPNGDVLLLLRKYSAIEGVAVKVLHIKAEEIRADAILEGQEILHLTPEGPVDNMEGLDVVVLDDNSVRMVMISDDNFSPLQRTLLMMFDYNYR